MKQIKPMSEIQHIMGCLSEECGEVVQQVSKINRFGLDCYNPKGDVNKTNEQLLNDEFNDILGVIEMLQERGINIQPDRDKIEAKKQKVIRYMGVSRELGLLEKE